MKLGENIEKVDQNGPKTKWEDASRSVYNILHIHRWGCDYTDVNIPECDELKSISVIKLLLRTLPQNKLINKMTEEQLVYVVAFLIVCVAFGLWFVQNNQLNEIKPQRRREYAEPISNVISLRERTISSTYKLVLLLKSERNAPLLDMLEDNFHNWTEDNLKSLYSATQCLWLGSMEEFQSSHLKKVMHSRSISSFAKSEYDVHFIELDLDESNPGFYKTASLWSRRDAFMRLKPLNIKVSGRFHCKYYANTELYNR